MFQHLFKCFMVLNSSSYRIISSGVDICGIETCEILYPFSKLNIWAANYRSKEKRDVSTHGIFAFMRGFEPSEMVKHNLLQLQIHNNFNHLDKLLLDVKCYKFVDICTHATKSQTHFKTWRLFLQVEWIVFCILKR